MSKLLEDITHSEGFVHNTIERRARHYLQREATELVVWIWAKQIVAEIDAGAEGSVNALQNVRRMFAQYERPDTPTLDALRKALSESE